MSGSLLTAALAYAAKGWPVFPLKPKAKTPLTRHGFRDATTDEAQIRAWWEVTPAANIGIPTGRPETFDVLDVDGSPGENSLALLEASHGRLPETSETRTGIGRQILFRGGVLLNSSGKLGTALDTRGKGGYVVVPPSVHPNGRRYAWARENGTAAPPSWLVEAFVPKASAAVVPPAAKSQSPGRYGEAALASAEARVSSAPEGVRNDTLNREAHGVAQLAAGGEIPEAEAQARLRVAALTVGLDEAETDKTLRSAFSAGSQSPRTAPERPAPRVVRVADATIATPAEAEDISSEASPDAIISLTVAELLERPFPPRGQIVAPVLAEKSLAMLYAPRGIGKTWIAGTVGVAAASGSVVFPSPNGGRPPWAAPSPRRVVLFDGEMPARVLRDRFAQIIAGGPYDPGDRLRIVADDVQKEGLPSFVRPEVQRRMDRLIGDAELVIFDNTSTLFRGLDENDSQAWDSVQEWEIRLRREGRSVLFVHHAGKSGQQRGTSKREDVLDLVIALRRPENYVEEEGCRVEIHLEKARGITGPDVLPFEAKLTVSHGLATWATSSLADEELNAKIAAMRDRGMPTRKIGAEVGLDQSNVVRRLAKIDHRLKLAADAREKGDAHQPRISASGG